MEYEEFKSKLKGLSMNIKEFASFVGVHANNATRWKNNTVPLWVVRVVEGLEYKKELQATKDKLKKICDSSNS